MRRKARQAAKPENRPRFWGRHAVAAALANPERTIVRLWTTREAASAYDFDTSIPISYADAADLGRPVTRAAPPPGLAAELDKLPATWPGHPHPCRHRRTPTPGLDTTEKSTGRRQRAPE